MVHHIILLFFCGIICSLKESYGAKSSPRVVIVGAGVAGISAGVSLVDKGFEDVTILEAENRIGGRVHTVPFGPHTVDMGAHWVHGQEGNSVYEISNPLGLVRVDDFSALESTFVVNDGRELNTSVASELNELAFSLLEDSDNLRSENGSLRDYIMNRFRPIAEKKLQNEPLLQAFMKMEDGLNCLSNGCDKLSDVSASGAALYEQHGDNNCWSKGGYQNIIDLLLNQHPAVPGKKNPLKGKIELNCEVSNISWAGAEAVVKCLDGRSFMADHVIVTVSLGVLKAQHSTLFSPQLPNDKIVAIKNMGFGAIGKVFLRFDKEWEYGNQHYIFILRLENSTSQSKEYAWHDEFYGIFPESCVPSVNTIWLAGDATRQMENRTEEQVLNEVSQTLNKLLGKKYNLPRIQSILRSKWYSNPHFRGSYSYITESAQKLNATNEALARPLTNSLQKQILLFAGEATHSRFYSTVHGALDSGRREAKRIAEMYQQIVS